MTLAGLVITVAVVLVLGVAIVCWPDSNDKYPPEE